MAAEEDKIRQIFESAMNRIENFINSRRFLESDLELLKVKEEYLKSLFTDFTNQHSQIVRFRSQDVFDKHNEHYAEVEERYQEMLVEFRKQMVKKERERETIKKSDEMETGAEEGEIFEPDSSSENTSNTPTSNAMKSCVVVVSNKPNPQRTVLTNARTHRPYKMARIRNIPIPQRTVQSDESNARTYQSNDKMARSRQYGTPIRERIGYKPKTSAKVKCNNCGGTHKMFKCHFFLNMSVAQRRLRVRDRNLCPNCLMIRGDSRHRCDAETCRRCGAFHNSLLCAARLIDKVRQS